MLQTAIDYSIVISTRLVSSSFDTYNSFRSVDACVRDEEPGQLSLARHQLMSFWGILERHE